jgi:hypothetical protein
MPLLEGGSSKAKSSSKWCLSSALQASFTCLLFISVLDKIHPSLISHESADCGFLDANKMLVEQYKSRWKTFLLYEMPEMFKADCFTTYNYMLICDFIKEMQGLAANYAEAAPHHIQEAEEKAPTENWKSPISFKEWMERDYERRWGRQRGL